ncbi:MAG: diphthine--ammonia ligase [Candidatus Omnitrophota bacterium]
MKEKIIFCWSSGKDSALALYKIYASKRYEVISLLVTVTEGYERISMHGVRKALVEMQREALGLPLETVFIPKDSTNAAYEAGMQLALSKFKQRGVNTVAFGDIFLQDLRDYRENNLAKLGMSALFPLWKCNSSVLANEFIDLGFKAIVTCVDTRVLGREFCGREFNRDFLAQLPKSADPCGENGEFHTFTYAGPIFSREIDCARGELVLRDNRFFYCDLIQPAPCPSTIDPLATLREFK